MANRGLRSFLLMSAAAVTACVGVSQLPGDPQPGRIAQSTATVAPLPEKVDFNRDIRPILSDNCFTCHGPDKNKRKANLRLDTKDGLLSAHDDVHNIVVGHPEKSELFRRITTADPDERMPDPNSNKKLSERDIALIKKWIEQGASYKGHWSFIPPVRPELPAVDEPGFVRNPIDRFILERLKTAGLPHAPEADRVTLIRRVYFDLVGLPPTRAEVDAFVADKSPDAYEKVVDRLLANPHFGEKLAMYWLDLVRFADTIGYHSDNPMNVTPYRDYVIDAFNQNMPFDRFTVEQLAGDLLPEPTTTQKVATAYNRLLQTTQEGGAQPKEYEQKYVADRVRNVSTVWMAATMGCCQCHDHKFDPFPTKEFYSLGAFFADVQEASIGQREPGIPVPDAQETAALKELDAAIAGAKRKLEIPADSLTVEQTAWESAHRAANVQWQTLEPKTSGANGVQLTRQPDQSVLAARVGGRFAAVSNYTFTASTDLKQITAVRLETLPDDSLPDHGPGTAPNGNFVLTEFKLGKPTVKPKKEAKAKAKADAAAPAAKKAGAAKAKAAATEAAPAAALPALVRATADFSQDGFAISGAVDGRKDTGWAISPQFGKPHTAVFELAKPFDPENGGITFGLEFQSVFPQHEIGRFRISVTASPDPGLIIPDDIAAIIPIDPSDRTLEQSQKIAAFFHTVAPSLQPLRDQIATLEKKKANLLVGVRKCLVTVAGSPRTVRVLPRGNWLDETGEVVEPGTPHVLGTFNVTGRRATRLDLAKWLVSHDNPLTARVFVNRLWKLYFGQGISKVLDDVGAQGEWPTHPELLDWLAVEFAEPSTDARASGGVEHPVPWDIKHMIRLLVTSGTYRQSSKPTATQREADPYNRLYARQSRFRLDAEIVRDSILDISGLLSDRIGGPSVFPYQPAGYWFALNFPTREWKNDTGDGLYRRGMYTHWQRSFPQPSMLAFDASTREEAVCERNRSNIPQQALVLLNDPTYVEASRALAERMILKGGEKAESRIRFAFGEVLSRNPNAEELKVLADLYETQRGDFDSNPDSAKKLLAIGEHKPPADVDASELASWTSVARTILNLSETITRY